MAAPSKPKYIDVSIDAVSIPADLLGFPFAVDLSLLPSVGFWDTVTSGDDLVAYTTAEAQLDTDCVYFDGVAEKGLLIVKDDPSTISGNTLRIYFGEAGATSEHVATAHGTDHYYASFDGGQTDRGSYGHGSTVFTGTGHTLNAAGGAGPFGLPWVAWLSDQAVLTDYGTFTLNPPPGPTGTISSFCMRRDENDKVTSGYGAAPLGAYWRYDANSGVNIFRSRYVSSAYSFYWGLTRAQATTGFNSFDNRFSTIPGQGDPETQWAPLTQRMTVDSLDRFDMETVYLQSQPGTPQSQHAIPTGWATITGQGGYNSAAQNTGTGNWANWDVSVVIHYLTDKGLDWSLLQNDNYFDMPNFWNIGTVTDNPDFGGPQPPGWTNLDFEDDQLAPGGSLTPATGWTSCTAYNPNDGVGPFEGNTCGGEAANTYMVNATYTGPGFAAGNTYKIEYRLRQQTPAPENNVSAVFEADFGGGSFQVRNRVRIGDVGDDPWARVIQYISPKSAETDLILRPRTFFSAASYIDAITVTEITDFHPTSIMGASNAGIKDEGIAVYVDKELMGLDGASPADVPVNTAIGYLCGVGQVNHVSNDWWRQSDPAAQPIYKTGNYLEFDGVNDALINTLETVITSAPWTVTIRAYFPSAGRPDDQIIFAYGAGDQYGLQIRPGAGDDIVWRDNGGIVSIVSGVSANFLNIELMLELHIESGNSYLIVNDVTYPFVPANFPALQRDAIGPNTAALYPKMYFYGLIGYPGAYSASLSNEIKAFLRNLGDPPIDITIQDIEVATELDNVVIEVSSDINLVVDDLDVITELDQPTLTRGRTIAVQGLEVATELDAITVAKTAGLNVADIQVATELDNVTVDVSQGISLTIQNTEITPESDNVQIARQLALNVGDLEIQPELDNVPVGKDTSLIIADLQVQPELDNVTVDISTGVLLNIQNIEVATEITGDLIVGRRRPVVPADVEISTELSTIDIGLNLTLAINDIDVQPEPQNVTLSIPGSQVFGSTNNVMILTPESTILRIT